jgi:Na+/proline symporter
MVGIIFIGIGFGKDLMPPEGWTNTQAILAFFSDSTVFPFLLTGLIAALLTTADSFLIAAVQTIVVDWIFAKALEDVNFEPSRLKDSEQKRMLQVSRVGIVILGAGSVLLGYILLSAIPTLLDLLFVIFGMQTALAPIVLWGLQGRSRPTDETAGVASIVAGGLAAIICLFLAILETSIIDVNIGLWSPVIVLLTAVITFATVRWLSVRRRL